MAGARKFVAEVFSKYHARCGYGVGFAMRAVSIYVWVASEYPSIEQPAPMPTRGSDSDVRSRCFIIYIGCISYYLLLVYSDV